MCQKRPDNLRIRTRWAFHWFRIHLLYHPFADPVKFDAKGDPQNLHHLQAAVIHQPSDVCVWLIIHPVESIARSAHITHGELPRV